MAWKGDSRRHSLARKGVKTASGRFKLKDYRGIDGRLKKPDMVMNLEVALKQEGLPEFAWDKGAIDGEPFGWIDFGWEDDYGIGIGTYVIVMNGDEFEVYDQNGNMLFRTDSVSRAEYIVKQLTIQKWRDDMLESPYGDLMDYVKDGELTEKGLMEYDRFAKLIMASGKDKKRAELTDKEEGAWNFAMEYYLNEGKSDEEADELAWKDIQQEFPRLKKYKGIINNKSLKSKGQLQFKTPINEYQRFMDKLSAETMADLGSDADYSDPNKFVTVIVDIPDKWDYTEIDGFNYYDHTRNRIMRYAKEYNARLKYEEKEGKEKYY